MKMKLSNCCCILVLLLGSCSIQKRVHRPGYAIEWNLCKRTNNEHKQSTRNKKSINKTEPQQAETPAEEFVETQELASLHTSPENLQPAVTYQAKTTVQVKKVAPQKSATNTYKSKTTKAVKQYKPARQTDSDHIIKGLLFILVALLLYGLGLIFVSVLGLFGVVFLLIFSIAAIVFLVIGLIMMIVGLVS